MSSLVPMMNINTNRSAKTDLAQSILNAGNVLEKNRMNKNNNIDRLRMLDREDTLDKRAVDWHNQDVDFRKQTYEDNKTYRDKNFKMQKEMFDRDSKRYKEAEDDRLDSKAEQMADKFGALTMQKMKAQDDNVPFLSKQGIKNFFFKKYNDPTISSKMMVKDDIKRLMKSGKFANMTEDQKIALIKGDWQAGNLKDTGRSMVEDDTTSDFANKIREYGRKLGIIK